MENGFWDSLKEIAAEKNISVNQLIADVDAKDPKNLSSALRLYILAYYKTR